MMLKLLASGVVLIGAFFTVNNGAVSSTQDEKKAQDDQEKVMAVYEKAAVPGEIHKALTSMAGKWQQKGECPMGTMEGTVEYRPILGGRFVVGEAAMKMMITGKPPMDMQNFQILGYDNVSKQYQTTWLDSMGTGIYFSTGAADASGKKITYDAPVKDALTPQGRPFKVVVNIDSDDKRTIEVWDSKKDGKTLVKEATIVETRM